MARSMIKIIYELSSFVIINIAYIYNITNFMYKLYYISLDMGSIIYGTVC